MTNEQKEKMIQLLPSEISDGGNFAVYIHDGTGFNLVEYDKDVFFTIYSPYQNIYGLVIKTFDNAIIKLVFYGFGGTPSFNVAMSNIMTINSQSMIVSAQMLAGFKELWNDTLKLAVSPEVKVDRATGIFSELERLAKTNSQGVDYSIAASLCFFYGNHIENDGTILKIANKILQSSIEAAFFFSQFQHTTRGLLSVPQKFLLLPFLRTAME